MFSAALCRRLTFLAMTVTSLSVAAADGSATGGIRYTSDRGPLTIEFNARSTDASGGASGILTFRAPVELPDTDEDDPFGQKGTADLSMKVELDCLVVAGARASMSGLVRDASVTGYTGRRMVLTVEDGGEGQRAEPDKFTWGMYAVESARWSPSDAELSFDAGAGLTWLATDSERTDDAAISVTSRQRETDCRSFGLASYALTELPQGSGNIQVRP